ncbi:hypothetical protein GGF46_003000 [Coemansia sp. RSA 552]|nr:hypothetical protein GGF46_003000 [Coemansia sp. RSA 552]
MALGQDSRYSEAQAVSAISTPQLPLQAPVTPDMSTETLLAASSAAFGSFYSGADASSISAAAAPSDSAGIASAFLGFAGVQCEDSEPLYPQGYTKLNEQLQGVLVMPTSVATPPSLVSSPEFLHTTGATAAARTDEIAAIAGHNPLGQVATLSYPPPHTQQWAAPLAQSIQGGGSPVLASVPAPEGFVYSTPIMGSGQMPAEPLFGNISYSDANSTSSGSAAFAPNMACTIGPNMQMYAYSQPCMAQNSIPSLAQPPQQQPELAMPDALALNTHGTPLPGFDSFSLIGGQPPEPPALPFGGPFDAPTPLSRLQRSLSTDEPERARSSSPNLARLGAHPYISRRNTSGAGGAQFRRIRSHTRAGSDVIAGCMSPAHPMYSQQARDASLWRRLQGGSPSSSSLPTRASSIFGQMGAGGREGSSEDDGDVDSEPQRTPSGRIPLTRDQREVFFRWLYQNSHDPKPKGSERDRLRCIGKMTRERFKTWFANARRRYFKITYQNGVQKYTVNERFRVACQRANIKLD